MSTKCFLYAALLALACAALASAETKEERGKYLVENVMVCGECHTPRTPDGQYDMSKWLKGAVLNVKPLEEIKGWHKTSPDLTSGSRLFLKWGEKGLVTFMQTGKGPSGNKADPPMPAYKLNADDAEAVVAYLKSLK